MTKPLMMKTSLLSGSGFGSGFVICPECGMPSDDGSEHKNGCKVGVEMAAEAMEARARQARVARTPPSIGLLVTLYGLFAVIALGFLIVWRLGI